MGQTDRVRTFRAGTRRQIFAKTSAPKAARGGNDPAGRRSGYFGLHGLRANLSRSRGLASNVGLKAIGTVAKVRSRCHSGATEILPVIFG